MRVSKNFHNDLGLITRFLDVFGGGSAILGTSKHARPGFFIFAHNFIHEYVEERFYKKEDLLLKALEDCGFPSEDGPVGLMRTEQKKSSEAAESLVNAAKAWQAGDETARAEVSWAASEYSSTFRQHIDRLKTRIFPLLEQSLSPDDEHKIAAGINNIVFENSMTDEPDKYTKLVEALEDELSDWK